MIKLSGLVKLGVLLSAMCFSCKDRPSHEVTSYHFSVIQRADSFFAWIDFVSYDTTTYAVSDGILIRFDPSRIFFGYDSSVIKFNGPQIVPVSAGRTMLRVLHPDSAFGSIVDSAMIEVKEQNGKYVISTLPPD